MASQQQLQNTYHLRTVAETSSKSCMICYKPTTAVLITPDNRDFFYICRGHLSDKAFCSAIISPEEAAAKKKKDELVAEIERIKKEYDEKMKSKRSWWSTIRGSSSSSTSSEKAKDGKEKEKDKKGEDDDVAKLEREKDEKIKAASSASGSTSTTAGDDIPRVYSLHRNFFQMRLDRIRNAEIAKRNRERLSNPSAFPSVPKDLP